MNCPALQESLISCETRHGFELRATLVRVTRFLAVFEIYSSAPLLQTSDVLNGFSIFLNERRIYSGRAVVRSLINTGVSVLCEVTLEESGLDLGVPVQADSGDLKSAYAAFLTEFRNIYKVIPEFKVMVADLQMVFAELRLWMEQLELRVRSEPSADRLQLERKQLQELAVAIVPSALDNLDNFEAVAHRIDADLAPVHQAYMRRQIHPIVLCSPFLYRTYYKPLGYAGDYEMVNMMLRDPFEGGSMFAKMMNRIFLETPPVVAHRQRIDYLNEVLDRECRRQASRHQALRVHNLGCGPAWEVQAFLARSEFCDRVHFQLLDFNEETLGYTRSVLEETRSQHHRSTTFELTKKSVQQLLKEAGKPRAKDSQFDLVYCAGLFDYLQDSVCKRLVQILYEWVAPGGLLVATNVDRSNPSRHWMEYVLDWHLIYRDANEMKRLIDQSVSTENAVIQGIGRGVNIAVEVRKPVNA